MIVAVVVVLFFAVGILLLRVCCLFIWLPECRCWKLKCSYCSLLKERSVALLNFQLLFERRLFVRWRLVKTTYLVYLQIYFIGTKSLLLLEGQKPIEVSILGPMLFNLYVSDLQDHLPSSIGPFQYADDTTIYSSCPAPALQRCAQELNSTLNTVSSWSNDSHLSI